MGERQLPTVQHPPLPPLNKQGKNPRQPLSTALFSPFIPRCLSIHFICSSPSPVGAYCHSAPLMIFLRLITSSVYWTCYWRCRAAPTHGYLSGNPSGEPGFNTLSDRLWAETLLSVVGNLANLSGALQMHQRATLRRRF